MTTAIEQAKREMYQYLNSVKCNIGAGCVPVLTMARLEEALETYLEQLRQQYEEMAATAHSRFESIQSLESANQDLIDQLAKMTESRDMFRNLHQAATHAAIESHADTATPHQDSGDRASCEQPDANTAAIMWAVRNIQLAITGWGMGDLKAKKAMRQIAGIVNGDGQVINAMGDLEKSGYGNWFIKNDKCQHSFFAIGDDKMKCTFCGVGK